MAPGRAADVNQDRACCRADSEPAGSSRPDDVKPTYMYGIEVGEVEDLSHVGGGKFVTLVTLIHLQTVVIITHHRDLHALV